VFPCSSDDKSPLTEHGFKNATTSLQIIDQWAFKYSNALVGVPTGKLSGFTVLDFDPKCGITPESMLPGLPETRTHRTQSGGVHALFKYTKEAGTIGTNVIQLPPGACSCGKCAVDLRNDGGYIIVPDSVMANGNRYTHISKTQPTEMPDWILSKLRNQKAQKRLKPKEPGVSISEGQRHGATVSYAGRLRNMRLNGNEILSILTRWNEQNCNPPLPDSEIQSIAKSADEWNVNQHNVVSTQIPPSIRHSPNSTASQFNNSPQFPQTPQFPAAIGISPPAGMRPEAYHGIAGEYVEVLEQHTEAASVAILLQLLVGFGAVIGRSAHWLAGDMKHFTNEFVLLIGSTSSGRKGTSYSEAMAPLRYVDELWFNTRCLSGLTTSEGLIHTIRDESTKARKATEQELKASPDQIRVDEIIDYGIADKRLLAFESELASPLTRMKREGNSLSTALRDAWDSANLSTLTKNNPSRATDPHISLIAHITPTEFKKVTSDLEVANGLLNRFIPIYVTRSRLIPEPTRLSDSDLEYFIQKIGEAVDFAKNQDVVPFDVEASNWWHHMYPILESDLASESISNMAGRSSAHVRRIAVIFALLELCDEVRLDHLVAAIAVWEYALRTIEWLYPTGADGNSDVEAVMDYITAQGGNETRTHINKVVFKKNASKEQLDHLKNKMLNMGLIEIEEQGFGTPEKWFLTGNHKETAENVKSKRIAAELDRVGNGNYTKTAESVELNKPRNVRRDGDEVVEEVPW
jgi:hypothetical protein